MGSSTVTVNNIRHIHIIHNNKGKGKVNKQYILLFGIAILQVIGASNTINNSTQQ